MPAQMLSMIRAEIAAIFGRWSGRGALVLALVVGLFAVGALEAASRVADNVNANGSPAASMLTVDWATCVAWSLQARNFFVLPLLIVLAGASTLSGELKENTLREVLVRPVPRWSVVFAKVSALAVLSLATLVLTAVAAVGGGAVMFPMEESITGHLTGFAMSWLSDLGLITMTLFVASFSRSVGGVVVGLALYLIGDWLLGGLLGFIGQLGVDWAPIVKDFLPGTALQAWKDWDVGFESKRVGALVAWTLITWVLATVRVQRMDVP
jgi:ABC-type transport system involved in multi-copper enzyme maturation permease subunit